MSERESGLLSQGMLALVAGVSIIGCTGKHTDKSIPALSQVTAASERDAQRVSVLVVKLKDNSNQQERLLDQQCSFQLTVGDKDPYRVPLKNTGLTVDFELEITSSASGIKIGGLTVNEPMNFGVIVENTDTTYPLGFLIPTGADELFLAPYKDSEQFRLNPCIKLQ